MNNKCSFDVDFSMPLLMNIKCTEHCILCTINYQEGDDFQIIKCNLNFCPKHLTMAMKGCIK